MNKQQKEAIEIIREYLALSSIYGYFLCGKYEDMKAGVWDGIEYSPHGNGIKVMDSTRSVEIDFDYFRYDGVQIRYFNLWKVNLFAEVRLGKRIEDQTFSSLMKLGLVKKYYKSEYYELDWMPLN